MAPTAAEALRLTAEEVFKLGVIDAIVPEPNGGAHQDTQATFNSLDAALTAHLSALDKLTVDELHKERFEKYRKMGVYREL
jgi:acetyl-CoA carboxylase carboxyl transferase subunit alpha